MNTPSNPAAQPQFALVKIGELQPSKNNPRKNFDVAKLAELAESIKAQGILQPLLVRPVSAGAKQVVAGERRLRAAKIAGLAEVPCIIRDLTDTQAEEAMNVENLQRDDLTPIEEAASYRRLLELKDAKGTMLYPTAVKLAARLGVSAQKIHDRMLLLALPPAAAQAVESGALSQRIARMIGRVPDPKARAEVAQRVLDCDTDNYRGHDGPLTYEEVAEMIADNYMVGLARAPFALDDAKLLAKAGACATCPKMTDNCAHLFDANEQKGFKQQKMCLDPGCHREKLAVVAADQVAAAKQAGKVVLDDEASTRIYPAHSSGMSQNSSYVEIAKQPLEHLIRDGIKQRPSWKTLVEQAEKKTGQKVPRVMIKDQAGVFHECVEARLAVTCVEESGEKIFEKRENRGLNQGASGPGSRVMTEADKKARKKLIADNQANREAVRDTLEIVLGRLSIKEELDAAAVNITVKAAFESHYSIKEHVSAVAKRLNLVLPAGFSPTKPSWLAKVGSLQLIRLAAGCLAVKAAQDAERNASPAPEELAALALGVEKKPAPPPKDPAHRRGSAATRKAAKGGAKK